MRKINFCLIFVFFSIIIYPQDNLTHKFLIEIQSSELLNGNISRNGKNNFLILNSVNQRLNDFFNNSEIIAIHQSFPSSKRQKTLNVYTFETLNNNLGDYLVNNFSEYFIRYYNITNDVYELASTYPNDYGSTSPVSNFGVNAEISSHDYVGVVNAWDKTYGTKEIIIGISDSKVYENDADLFDKTTFLSSYPYHNTPFNMSNIVHWHGTNTATTAAAQGNNSHGMSGICSNCSILAGDYGDYNLLLDFAYAGAKIINMSWTYYSSTINNAYQDIIDEVNELGVVMVASSGNRHITPPNYPYPASFNHVISVTSVNHKNEVYQAHGLDSTIPSNSQFYNIPLSYYVKDMISPRVAPNYNEAV